MTEAGRSPKDLDAFASAVRTFLSKRVPEAETRRVMSAEANYDPGTWATLSREMGVSGLLVPTELGGSGAGQRELALVLHEFGRSLAPAPVLSTVALGVNLLLQLRDEWVDDVLTEIVTGTKTVAVSIPDMGADGGSVAAQTTPTGATVTGSARYVVDAASADLFLLLTELDGQPAIVAVTATAPGVTTRPIPALDLTRGLADLTFPAAPARMLARGKRAETAATRTRQLGAIALAAECSGIAERSLERSIEHARTRIQFGRAIGSFQAVKHRCARMFISQQLSAALVDAAVDVADGAPGDLALSSSAALASAAQTAYRIAADTIQIHGGIGFTWEDASHLYFKRASSNRHVLGELRDHKRVVATSLGI